MSKRIPKEIKEKISRLYNRGLSPADIARRTGVSYTSVYGMTKARQKVNPETGERFKSRSEYQNYLDRQKVNPETGERFKSLSQYLDYKVRQKVEKNRKLSDLIASRLKELGQNQSWLAEQLGVTPQAVSLYVQGKSAPSRKRLERLIEILDTNHETRPKNLSDLFK